MESENRFKHLIYTYEFTKDMNLNTANFTDDISKIKKEFIQTPDKIVMYCIYPNGFEILSDQMSDRIIFKTNYPLVEVSANQYEVQFD